MVTVRYRLRNHTDFLTVPAACLLNHNINCMQTYTIFCTYINELSDHCVLPSSSCYEFNINWTKRSCRIKFNFIIWTISSTNSSEFLVFFALQLHKNVENLIYFRNYNYNDQSYLTFRKWTYCLLHGVGGLNCDSRFEGRAYIA